MAGDCIGEGELAFLKDVAPSRFPTLQGTVTNPRIHGQPKVDWVGFYKQRKTVLNITEELTAGYSDVNIAGIERF